MEALFTSSYCEECDLLFLVGNQDEINANPYCPNCGNDYCVEFKEVVFVTMRDAFVKLPKSGDV